MNNPGHVTLLHLSDPHITHGEPLYGSIDGLARLCAAVEAVTRSGAAPDAVVITGDLIQAGHSTAYPAVRAEVDRIERDLGVPVVAVPGNHDDAAAFRQAFAVSSWPATAMVGGLRLIMLDSASADLDDDQLDRLAALAAGRGAGCPLGTVLILHHPPVPSPLAALAGRGLARPERLAAALAGARVRLILAGHYHHAVGGEFAGTPVWAGPALSYQQIMTAGPDRVSGYDQPMYSMITVTAGTVTAVPVPLVEPLALFSVPAGFTTTASVGASGLRLVPTPAPS